MPKAINYKLLLYYLPIGSLIFLFIYLGFFGVASSDDYADYMLVQKMGFLNAFEETYMHWGGRFTSYFLVFLLNPLNLGEQFGPALLYTCQIILFLFIPYLFTRILFKERKFIREMIIAFSLIAGFILCYLPSPVELLYWFTGSWVYLPGLVFMLYWYVLIEKESKSKVDKLIIVALPFFIAGTNEMNILLMAWLLLYSCLKSNHKRIIYF